MKTEIKTCIKIGAVVGRWPRLLSPKEVKAVESYVSECTDPCPELIAKAEAIFDVNEMAKLEAENAELRKDKARLDWLLRHMDIGDVGDEEYAAGLIVNWEAIEEAAGKAGVARGDDIRTVVDRVLVIGGEG